MQYFIFKRMDLRGHPEMRRVGDDGNSNRYDESICQYVIRTF